MREGVARKDLKAKQVCYVNSIQTLTVYRIELISRHCNHPPRKDGQWVWLARIYTEDGGYIYDMVHEVDILATSEEYNKVAKRLEIQAKIDKLQRELKEL